MMIYQNELWLIHKFFPCDMNEPNDGFRIRVSPTEVITKKMGGWLIYKISIEKIHGSLHPHRTIIFVWEDNPAQPYELIFPS